LRERALTGRLWRVVGAVEASSSSHFRNTGPKPAAPMTLKSVWAILAGILATIIVTTLVDVLLHVLKIYPGMDQPLNDSLAALATAYRIPISVWGAWLTARLAPSQPMRHTMILGVIGTILGAVGAIVTWNKNLGPHWYPVTLAVLSIPQCWLGGHLFIRSNAVRG